MNGHSDLVFDFGTLSVFKSRGGDLAPWPLHKSIILTTLALALRSWPWRREDAGPRAQVQCRGKAPQEDWGVPNYSCTTTGCSQLILLHYSCNTTSGVLNFGPTSTTFSYNSTILAILLWGVPNFEPTNTSESCIVKETQHFCCKVEEVGPRKILTKVNNVREFFIAVLLY